MMSAAWRVARVAGRRIGRATGLPVECDAARGAGWLASPCTGGPVRRFGLFDSFKKKLEEVVEADEDLKKSVEDLKKAKVGDKTVEEASGEFGEKVSEGASRAAERMTGFAASAKEKLRAAKEASEAAAAKAKEAQEAAKEGKMGARARKLREEAARLKEEASKKAQAAREAASKTIDDSEFVKGAREKVDEAASGAADKLGGKGRLASAASSFAEVMGQVFGKKKRKAPVIQEYPWTEYLDHSEKLTYYNKITHEITHDKPADFDEKGGVSVVGEQSDATGVMLRQRDQSAWERVNEKLRNTPIISSVYAAGEAVVQSEPVQKAKAKIKDKQEDIRETWETSQNPWVYRTSYALDSVFSESEEAQAISGIRKLDPGFSLPEFIDEMVEDIVPAVVGAYLRADRKTLDYWLSEDAYARTNAALKARDVAGLIVDPNLLEVSSCEVVSAKVPERGEPMMICQVMCQQINCTTNREGDIVEGSENEIRAVIYAFVMQKVYLERRNEVAWQVAELGILGTQLYL